jgi:hypothetical protein
MMITGNRRNHSPLQRAARILLAVSLAPGLGCGKQADLAPTAGVVHLEGAPMTSGKVLFTPLGPGKPAAGDIQSDGSFVLSTYDMNDGAKPGRHRVTIVGAAKSEEQRIRPSWMAPKDHFIEIEAGKKNDLKIDVKLAAGWKKLAED